MRGGKPPGLAGDGALLLGRRALETPGEKVGEALEPPQAGARLQRRARTQEKEKKWVRGEYCEIEERMMRRTERQVRRGEKFTGEDGHSRIPPSSPRPLGVSILTVHHFPCEYLGEVKRQRCSVCGMYSSLSGFEDSHAHVHIGDNRVNRGRVGLYP